MMNKKLLVLVLAIFLFRSALFPAVGCDLNDPDRDVKRLFPESTSYKTIYVSISDKGGPGFLGEVESRLGDGFKGLYETADVPYTMYLIYRGQELVGYIHGVNQKGHYGGLQVFLALDTRGTIRAFYYQKLTSRSAKELRSPEFGRQFVGLSLMDFYGYDPVLGLAPASNRVGGIKNPAPEAQDDFRSTLRAVKKNLILVDEFVLGNKYLPYFKPRQ